MITLKSLGITTLTAITVLSLNACNRTNSTQKAAESSVSRVSITDGNARAEAYLNDAGREIRMAIKNGEMTEEEGRLKYAAIAKRVEKRMAGAKPKTADTDARARRARYQEAVDKMTEMVKSGEITREQMQQRLDRMKKAMGGDKSKTFTKEDYDLAASKMARMVKAGEITREDMKTRLGEMRKAMSQSSDRNTSSADQRARRARYQEAVDKMTEMVKAGEITQEQMETRLDGMKKRMSAE